MKKKNPTADLESKRPYFFKIGLIIACSLVWYVFEWETAYATPTSDPDREETTDYPEDEDQLKVFVFKQPEPPAPPKKESVEKTVTKSIVELRLVEFETEGPDIDEPTEIIDIIDPDEEAEELIIMAAVQFKPQFPGCEDAGSEDERFTCFQQSIMNHIKSNFKYPAVPKGLGKEGKVYVKFIIDKKGMVTDINIDRAVDRYLGEEAKRLIGMLPQMTPARQFNKPVAVEYIVPINFRLN